MGLLTPKIVTSYGQRPPRCELQDNPLGPDSTVFIHYSASDGAGIDKRGEPRQAVLNIQAHHQDGNGWCDTGYSWIVVQPRGIFKRPIVFKGRGFGKVPAAQEGHNTGNVAICVIADSNDRISRATFRAIAYLVRRCPARNVKGHRDVNSTSCPGDRLYSKLDELRRIAREPKAGRLP
ncbi:MAG TPA: peptidoglycan recognition family protein [Solirubrobacterales bacterium]